MRFLFPALPFVPIMFSMVLETSIKKLNLNSMVFFKLSLKFIIFLSLLINSILVILVLSLPASKEVALWQDCFNKYLSSESSVILVLDPDSSGSTVGELELDFYNIRDVPIISVSNESQISGKLLEFPDKKFLYTSRKKDRTKELFDNNVSNRMVCQALPQWILKININNWTSRASIWRVWEIY